MNWRPPVMRASLLLMESLWVYALGALFLAITVGGAPPSFFAAAVVVFTSFAISRGFRNADLPLGIVRAWGTLLSFLLFYAIVRVDYFGDWRFWDFSWADQLVNHTEATLRDKASAVLGIPFLWAFWLRGLFRGQQYLGFESVLASFATGLVIVAGVVLFAGALDMADGADFVAVPYLAVGLMTVGLAHAGRSEEEFGRSFAPTWLLAVAAAILLLAGAASVVSLINRERAEAALETAGKGIGYGAGQGFYYTTYPVVYGTEQILLQLEGLFEGALGGPREDLCLDGTPEGTASGSAAASGTPAAGATPEPARCRQPEAVAPQPGEGKELPSWLKAGLRVTVAGVIVAVAALGVAMMFSRLRRREASDEVKESTYQEGRLSSDIGGFISGLVGRLRPSFRHQGETEPMRRLYFDMLNGAAQRGVERRSAETPLELSPRIERTFGAGLPGRITARFDDTRYGALLPPDEDVRRLREEWERLRRAQA